MPESSRCVGPKRGIDPRGLPLARKCGALGEVPSGTLGDRTHLGDRQLFPLFAALFGIRIVWALMERRGSWALREMCPWSCVFSEVWGQRSFPVGLVGFFGGLSPIVERHWGLVDCDVWYRFGFFEIKSYRGDRCRLIARFKLTDSNFPLPLVLFSGILKTKDPFAG